MEKHNDRCILTSCFRILNTNKLYLFEFHLTQISVHFMEKSQFNLEENQTKRKLSFEMTITLYIQKYVHVQQINKAIYECVEFIIKSFSDIQAFNVVCR